MDESVQFIDLCENLDSPATVKKGRFDYPKVGTGVSVVLRADEVRIHGRKLVKVLFFLF